MAVSLANMSWERQVYDKMRSMGKVSTGAAGNESASVCSAGDLGSVVSALRER